VVTRISAKIDNKPDAHKVEVQGDLLDGFAKVELNNTVQEPIPAEELERIVTELTDELLPTLKSRLEEKIRASLAAWKAPE